MKKILTHLTGIVFLITILVAAACSSEPSTQSLQEKKNVEIYCEAIEIAGAMHLRMYDSNDKSKIVIDTLHTDVKRGTKVIWRWVQDSEMQEFLKISPKKPGKIMKNDAKKIHGTKEISI